MSKSNQSILFFILFFQQSLFAQITPSITVDQFGWLPNAKKIAIVAMAERGQTLDTTFSLGGATVFEVVDTDNNNVVYSGALIPWKEGEVDESSGDKVWLADFTDFTEIGSYFLKVNDFHSFTFDISTDVYKPLLKPVTRTYYYWRTGTDIPEEYGGEWNSSFIHEQQQQARFINNGSIGDESTFRDVSGGWRDAGDFNKYVPFTATTMFNLLRTAENSIMHFGDDFNIPESGNGVPDLIDEIKWELDWLLKMQFEDGSVSNRVGHACNTAPPKGDPGSDNLNYYYTQATTWSTAIATAIFAKAYLIFENYQSAYPDYHQQLLDAATKGWAYLENQPSVFPSDGFDGTWNNNGTGIDICAGSGAPSPGDTPEMGDRISRAWAAAELYTLTGDTSFLSFFEENITKPYSQFGVSQLGEMAPSVGPVFNLAVWAYLKSNPPASSVKNLMISSFKNGLNSRLINPYHNETDPYQAYMPSYLYNWGTNEKRMQHAVMLIEAIELGIDESRNALFREITEEYVHNLHGRNPLAFTYLTKMDGFGADKSVNTMFNKWFHHESSYDKNPPSGFLVGGPVGNFINRGAGGGNEWWRDWIDADGGDWLFPSGWDPNLWTGKDSDFPAESYEPRQKSYEEINNDWPIPSWVLNEAGIYYQAAYLRSLSYLSGEITPSEKKPVVSVSFSDEQTDEAVLAFNISLSHNAFDGQIIVEYTLSWEGQEPISNTLTFLPEGDNFQSVILNNVPDASKEVLFTINSVSTQARLSPTLNEAIGKLDAVLGLKTATDFLKNSWIVAGSNQLFVEVGKNTEYSGIMLISPEGKRSLWKENGMLKKGINSFKIPLSDFSKGLYMVVILNKNNTGYTIIKGIN